MTLLKREEIPSGRGIYCNRTLNLRNIAAIGYDMDYTLVHYRVDQWEQSAFSYIREKLAGRGWPVEDLNFNPDLMVRGLVIDLEEGNLLKANRFGYVKHAHHGTRMLSYRELRQTYAFTLVDLSSERFLFVNTLFELSEICMYAHLVDRLDARELPSMLGYAELYRAVRRSLDEAHWEGHLKREILTDPERFIDLDPDTPQALLDQRQAGKILLLITNSEWTYSSAIMHYAFDRYLPAGMGWQDLFDLIIVSARKPEFFSGTNPFFQIVDESGLLRPVTGPLINGECYLGGNANAVETHFGLSGDDFLYIGDHIFSDVHLSKSLLRWRTALVLRELEIELSAIEAFRSREVELGTLMRDKIALEFEECQIRLALQRATHAEGSEPPSDGPPPNTSPRTLSGRLDVVRQELLTLDQKISPLAQAAAKLTNEYWGLLMRAGNDKSHLARQIERYADIYTSRVSNFLFHSPFVYFRSLRGSLPHDPTPATSGVTAKPIASG